MTEHGSLGATYSHGEPCRFVVWVPNAVRVEVVLDDPAARSGVLTPIEKGYHAGAMPDVRPGDRYRFRLDGRIVRPDPASRFQPEGVHGPSEVVNPTFPWTDGKWKGLPLERYVLYELHVGTYTQEGTFAGVEKHLASLRELGVTAIELMPVAQFPGVRNWGYDGVFPFAVQNSYGGPVGLKHLVNAAHEAELAVVLDVVYNHLGPEGNYLPDFGPYFTSRHQTPWGAALNFDGPYSDEVRRFFIENALYWVDEFHFDALRLDAVHAIMDHSAYPFVQQLTDAAHERAKALGRLIHVIAEYDDNDSRLCRPLEAGGLGCDAQWSDDLHHALYAQLTGERNGYYADFGGLDHIVAALRDGYVYQGQYSPFRRRRHGSSPKGLAPGQFVVCMQNHDQVGNRMMGDRMATLVSFETLKLAAGAIILSPFVPLLFMGEEYGETAPFQYFVDHSDPELIGAVRRGRREEFASFSWQGETPDPQDEATFRRCKLDHHQAESGRGAVLRGYYRELLRIRSSFLAPVAISKDRRHQAVDSSSFVGDKLTTTNPRLNSQTGHDVKLLADSSTISVTLFGGSHPVQLLLNFGEEPARITLPAMGMKQVVLNSADSRWGGTGQGTPVGDFPKSQALNLVPRSLLVILHEGCA